MSIDFGHHLTSAGFRVKKINKQGTSVYLEESLGLIAADPDKLIQSVALPIFSDQLFSELNNDLKNVGYYKRRGIIFDVDSGTPANQDVAIEYLVNLLNTATQNDMIDVVAHCQMWRLKEKSKTNRPEYSSVLETATKVFSEAIKRSQYQKPVHLQFLIKQEMADFNTLLKALQLVENINRALDERRVFVCVNLAHLIGDLSVDHWDRVFDEFYEAVEKGFVQYLIVSDPVTRNEVAKGKEGGRTPLLRFLKAVGPQIKWIDTEALNPDDPDLETLRSIPEFAGTTIKAGWPRKDKLTDWWQSRHLHFVTWSSMIRNMLQALDNKKLKNQKV